MNKSTVVLIDKKVFQYPPKQSLFRPGVAYPEYPFSIENISADGNEIYDGVRMALHYLHMDDDHWNTKSWNPLGEIVNPFKTVLVKPNLVMEANHIVSNGTDCLYANPSIVAAMIDYVIIANQGKGKIIVGDAPMQECKWDVLVEESGYKSLIEWYQNLGIDIELLDFRELSSNVVNGVHVQSISEAAKGHVVNLGNDSELAGMKNTDYEKMRVTNYDPTILPTHHNERVHEYYISDYVLNSDVIINVPKPKTHRKGGITISLKNFVGINVRKEYLPHHIMGSYVEGGDEYPTKSALHALRSKLYDKRNYFSANERFAKARLYHMAAGFCSKLLKIKLKKDYYQEGSWYGNETISKTICDLNKIAIYADRSGKMCSEPQRSIFIVSDMIVCGEKEGPVAPTKKMIGCIAAGMNLVCFDEMIATLMGFDIKKIPMLRTVRQSKSKYKIAGNEKPYLKSNNKKYDGKRIGELRRDDTFKFEPTSGWKGHIEIEG